MNLELNAEQLEFLKFIVQDFEYNDSNERAMIEAIESKIYNLQEKDALRLAGILKAQAKRPSAEW
tara:strand:- start:720 stop:914 length:195 start_codon:yes stop_codon:yes gene_type:complete